MIKDNLDEIVKRISFYCDPAQIAIIAVTKYQTIQAANEAINAGITRIGENKVQQLTQRAPLLLPCEKHLIGHLQTNKVKAAVSVADMIQSVDSVRVLTEINNYAGKAGKRQDVLLEINIANEPAKTGAPPSSLPELLSIGGQLENVRIQGLMAVMPIEINEIYYERMNALFEEHKNNGMTVLSMGMSNDYEIAVKHGSNMVRIGSALFM